MIKPRLEGQWLGLVEAQNIRRIQQYQDFLNQKNWLNFEKFEDMKLLFLPGNKTIRPSFLAESDSFEFDGEKHLSIFM